MAVDFVDGAPWTRKHDDPRDDFEPKHGLIAQLDCAAWPPGSAGTTFNNLTLVCTCLDPSTNPIPSDNPCDFTISEHG